MVRKKKHCVKNAVKFAFLYCQIHLLLRLTRKAHISLRFFGVAVRLYDIYDYIFANVRYSTLQNHNKTTPALH